MNLWMKTCSNESLKSTDLYHQSKSKLKMYRKEIKNTKYTADLVMYLKKNLKTHSKHWRT